MFSSYAHPGRFIRLGEKFLPWCLCLSAAFMMAALYLGLFASPVDYLQGNTVRIMYVHVPSAWIGVGLYASLALMGLVHLVWKHTVAQCSLKPIACVGAVFTAICLITGSIWGKPTWGTWWVWDARLTSMLVLLLLYVGVLAVLEGAEDAQRGANSAALLSIVGVVNLPIIKWSVTWWNTLHQPASLMKFSTPNIHASMLSPLILMTVGFVFFVASLIFLLTKKELYERRILILNISRRVLVERLEGKKD